MLGSIIAKMFNMMSESKSIYPPSRGVPWGGRPQPRTYGLRGSLIWNSGKSGSYRRNKHGEIGTIK